jgi:hypothetical protein
MQFQLKLIEKYRQTKKRKLFLKIRFIIQLSQISNTYKENAYI